MVGLEPTRLSALEPKSSAATNYATSAFVGTWTRFRTADPLRVKETLYP